MRLLICAVVLVVASGTLMLSNTGTARASGVGLTICNRTSDTLGIAVGYHSPGVDDPADHSVLTGPFVSTGWWHVDAGQCYTFANPFSARYMFWFGFTPNFNGAPILSSPDAHASNSSPQWTTNSDVQFCVTSFFSNPTHVNHMTPSFTFEDENESESACHRSAYALWLPARKVDTWVNATVDFTGQ